MSEKTISPALSGQHVYINMPALSGGSIQYDITGLNNLAPSSLDSPVADYCADLLVDLSVSKSLLLSERLGVLPASGSNNPLHLQFLCSHIRSYLLSLLFLVVISITSFLCSVSLCEHRKQVTISI